MKTFVYWQIVLVKELKMKQKTKGWKSMLLGTLCPSLLGNLLRVKGVKAKTLGWEVMEAVEGPIRAGEATIWVGQDF